MGDVKKQLYLSFEQICKVHLMFDFNKELLHKYVKSNIANSQWVQNAVTSFFVQLIGYNTNRLFCLQILMTFCWTL